MKVTFLGLGTMGFPMAGHLQQAGLDVCVYNRTYTKAQHWQNIYQGRIAQTPAQAAQDAEIVMICVGNDDDVRSVCYGEDGIFSTLKANSIIVDHTTTSADLAHELYAAAKEKGLHFIDAPVSGGQAGAENGQLTIMCGGDQAAFDTATPVLNHYAKSISRLGKSGAGQLCKMVNQVCIAGLLQGLSEGLTLAQKSGLDLVQVRDVIKHGAGQSWQLDNRTETIAQDKFDFGFAIDWMRKDLGICLDHAQTLDLELPITQQVDERYAKLQERGYGRMDTSVLIKAMDK